jgi:lysozyme family protein
VQTEVRIPDGTASGPATMDMVGADSEVLADLALQVAGAETSIVEDGAADILPLTAAAVALVAAVGGLVSVAGRQRMRRHTIRSA